MLEENNLLNCILFLTETEPGITLSLKLNPPDYYYRIKAALRLIGFISLVSSCFYYLWIALCWLDILSSFLTATHKIA